MTPVPFTGTFKPAERIVIPVQGTDREFLAQQWAVEFAAALGIPLVGIHVRRSLDDAEAERDDVFQYLQQACEKWRVKLQETTIEGDQVVNEIVPELGPMDLVVIGTRRLKEHYHMGSVAAELVRRAPCPVQIVRLE